MIYKNIFSYVFLGFVFTLISCGKYNLAPTTFKGMTQMGTSIGLKMNAKDGIMTGYGFHAFSSGKQNRVELKGTIDKKGHFVVQEHFTTNNQLFGEIAGQIVANKKRIIGTWTNKQGKDATPIDLTYTTLKVTEMLAMLPPPLPPKRQQKAPRDYVEDAKKTFTDWYNGK